MVTKIIKEKVFIILILIPSYLYDASLFNANTFIKEYGVTIVISIISLWSIASQFIKGYKVEIGISIIDLLFVLLVGINVIIFKENALVKGLMIVYYSLLYASTRIILNEVKLEHIKKILANFTAAILFIHIFIVVLQKFDVVHLFYGSLKNGSTFGNPDMLASYLAILFPFVFLGNKRFIKYLSTIILVGFFVIVQARTALLAVVLCGFCSLLLNKRISRNIIVLTLGVGTIFLSLLIYWQPVSVLGRFFVWYISILMIIQKPFGWGAFAFEKHYPEFQANFLSEHVIPNYITPDIVHSPFNEFLNIGVTLGVFGLLLYSSIIVVAFYYTIKAKSILVYPIIVFFVVSFSFFPLSIAPLMVVIIPMLAVVSMNSKYYIKLRFNMYVKNSLISLIIVVFLLLGMQSIKLYTSYMKWQKVIQLYESNINKNQIESIFCQLYPILGTNGRFLITYANFQYQHGNKAKALELMEESNKYFCDISSSINLAKLYAEFDMNDKAEDMFNLAINIAPDKFTSYYETILFFINKTDYKKAYDLCKDLYAKPIQKTNNVDPYIIKRIIEKYIDEYENTKKITISIQ